MGYTTEFSGQIKVDPPLSAEEVQFINKFNKTRRMNRGLGPYYVDGSGDFGQGRDGDILNFNQPPPGQPGLWCQWRATEDGQFIEWDGGEKFYDSPEWMKYIIEHFLGRNPKAKPVLGFLTGHTLNGEIEAQGEERDDRWMLIVENNVVKVADIELKAKRKTARKI